MNTKNLYRIIENLKNILILEYKLLHMIQMNYAIKEPYKKHLINQQKVIIEGIELVIDRYEKI